MMVFSCTKCFMVGIKLQYQPFIALNILFQVPFADSGCLLLFFLPTAYSTVVYTGFYAEVFWGSFLYMHIYVCVYINISKYTHIYICLHTLINDG